jgi:peptidoglycan/xylan/chitin deacetylase (PgdA/CDA1 family)
MIGKRDRLASLLDRVGVSTALVALRGRVRPTWLTVMTYHRIGTAKPDDLFPDDVYDGHAEQFDAELEYLSDRFRFVSSSDVIDFLDGGSLPPNPVMLSFDDGYLDNYETALPLLKRHNATATFFIATDYVDKRKLFWWDHLRVLMHRARNARFDITYPYALRLESASALDPLTRIVKTSVGLDLSRFLDHVGEQADASLTSAEARDIVDGVLMRWDHILALRDAGMDVQSHTCSHRVLQTLRADDLEHELTSSRALLERRLEREIRAIAYPVGYPVVDRPAILRAISDAGYRAGFTYQTGPIRAWAPGHRFNLNRLSHQRSWPSSVFRTMMAFPELALKRQSIPAPPLNSH